MLRSVEILSRVNKVRQPVPRIKLFAVSGRTEPAVDEYGALAQDTRQGARMMIFRRHNDKAQDSRLTDLWTGYSSLSHEDRNALCLRLLQDGLSDPKLLPYGWAVQRLYSSYATEYLPGREHLNILEIGPGDTLMTAALWMLEKRVDKLALMDKHEGNYFSSASYNAGLIDWIKTLSLLPRHEFNNYSPCEDFDIERVSKAVNIEHGKPPSLNSDLIQFVRTDDFTRFPFDDAGFDYVYSHAAMEHLTAPPATIAEMNRVLKPGGLMVHQIDMRDHRDFNDPYRFLEIPPGNWNFGDLCYTVNQWRACQYRDAFKHQGLDIVSECKIRREPEKAEGIRLAPEFAAMPEDDVWITGMTFIIQKPTGSGSK
jgi:SAM-dependent methyltransferase